MQDRIEQVAKEELARAKEARKAAQEAPEQAPSLQPQDYYQMQANAAYEASQRPTAYGAPAEMSQVVDEMAKDVEDHYYNAYNNQFQHLIDMNDNNGAQQTAQEYMMQYALPLVASLVEMYGADALLNNKNALSKLDSVMLTGNGAGDGFTESYLRQMHSQTLKTQGSQSDIEVVRGLRRAMGTASQSNIREAVAIARSLKNRIDKGELSASPEDYRTLLRVVEE